MWSMAVRLGPVFQPLRRHFSVCLLCQKLRRGKKKKPNPKPFLSVYSYSCISCLQQMVLSHWFLLFSLRVDLSYLSITAFKFD